MRRAGVAADGREIVAHGAFGNAGFLGDGTSRPCASVHGMQKCATSARLHAGLREQVRERRGHDLVVALVADPALFPRVVEVDAVAAIVIDEIDRAIGARNKFGDRLAFADQEGRRAVAGRQLERARRLGAPLFGGDDQRPVSSPRRPSASASADSPARCVAE